MSYFDASAPSLVAFEATSHASDLLPKGDEHDDLDPVRGILRSALLGAACWAAVLAPISYLIG